MACATIVIGNPAKALDLLTLLTKGAQAGYTVTPTIVSGFAQGARVAYLSVQSSPVNGAGTYVYKGDENVATGGCQGKELTPGTIDVVNSTENAVHLGEVFLLASVPGLKVNIEIHWA